MPRMEARTQSPRATQALHAGPAPIKRRRQAISMAVEWPEGEVLATAAREMRSGLLARCFQSVEAAPATTAKTAICRSRPNFLLAAAHTNPAAPTAQMSEIIKPSVVKRAGRTMR